MTNPNDPAYTCSMPVMAKNNEDGLLYKVGEQPRAGLTIREYFAAMAMQGLLARSTDRAQTEMLMEGSVEMADALIAELSKEVA